MYLEHQTPLPHTILHRAHARALLNPTGHGPLYPRSRSIGFVCLALRELESAVVRGDGGWLLERPLPCPDHR